MKRHPALVSLSRDHHHALLIARRLRQATERDAGEAVHAFLCHWQEEERLHFRLEEEVLLPAYAAHNDPNQPAVLRMLLDHILIRRDAGRLANEPPLELLHQLGLRLAAHVRLEENELFPLVEQSLPERALTELGQRLVDAQTLTVDR